MQRALHPRGVVDYIWHNREEDKLRGGWITRVRLACRRAWRATIPRAHLWINELGVADFHAVCFFNCGSLHAAGGGERFELVDIGPRPWPRSRRSESRASATRSWAGPHRRQDGLPVRFRTDQADRRRERGYAPRRQGRDGRGERGACGGDPGGLEKRTPPVRCLRQLRGPEWRTCVNGALVAIETKLHFGCQQGYSYSEESGEPVRLPACRV